MIEYNNNINSTSPFDDLQVLGRIIESITSGKELKIAIREGDEVHVYEITPFSRQTIKQEVFDFKRNESQD